MFGSSIWFCICVLELSSLLENNCFMKYYLTWWKKWNKYMFYQNWQITYLQQQVLTYGCQRGHMIYSLLSLICWDLIDNLNKWPLVCLRQYKLLVKPWPTIWLNYLINMDWKEKLLHMSKMRGQIWMWWQLFWDQLWNVKF